MNRVILLLMCVGVVSCSTTGHVAAMRVVRRVDAALAQARTEADFEHRLDQLGAKIEMGATPSEKRVASFPAPTTPGRPIAIERQQPGYFPPSVITIVYRVTDEGVIELRSAQVISLGNRLAKDP